jgi:hypothetical protein
VNGAVDCCQYKCTEFVLIEEKVVGCREVEDDTKSSVLEKRAGAEPFTFVLVPRSKIQE